MVLRFKPYFYLLTSRFTRKVFRATHQATPFIRVAIGGKKNGDIMPKIGTINLNIRGKLDRYEIHYSQKMLFEIRGIPDDVFRLTDTMPSRYETEHELVNTIHGALRRYHEIIKTQRKVIAYRIMLPSNFRMTREKRGHWTHDNVMIPANLKGKISDSAFDVNALDWNFGFLLEFEVFIEVDDVKKKYFSLTDTGEKDRERQLNKAHIIIDYSENKEAFFRSLELSTKSMVEKLLNFLGQDEQVLLSIMESGNTKLLN